MEIGELKEELEFVRAQIEVFEAKIVNLEQGSWGRHVSNDFDKSTIYNSYMRILSDLRGLIRHNYDTERF